MDTASTNTASKDTAPREKWVPWVWALTGLVFLTLLNRFLPPPVLMGILGVSGGIGSIVDLAFRARSRTKVGFPSKPWELAFFFIATLIMLITGSVMLWENW